MIRLLNDESNWRRNNKFRRIHPAFTPQSTLFVVGQFLRQTPCQKLLVVLRLASLT